MTTELYKVHRPSKLSEVVGQDDAIASLKAMAKSGKFPHAILFTGPSGCGKTTLARILKDRLKCVGMDFLELNAANWRGIDMVRHIEETCHLAALEGSTRIYLIDECHQLTPPAQDAFLKTLEDTPSHVYFFLATTDPQKLKKTVLTRCTPIKVRSLEKTEMANMLLSVCQKEDATVSKDVIKAIVGVADGSARTALVILNQVIGVEGENAQLTVVAKSDFKGEAIQIARALLTDTSWSQMARILSACKGEEPEGIRHLVLNYTSKVLMKGSNPRAYKIIEAFRDNFYDAKWAGVVAACWEVISLD